MLAIFFFWASFFSQGRYNKSHPYKFFVNEGCNNPIDEYTACSLLQIDVYGYRCITSVLEWMGIHSLSIFVLVTSNLAIIAIQGLYWSDPENNIVSVNRKLLLLKPKLYTTFLHHSFILTLPVSKQVHWVITRFLHKWSGYLTLTRG